MDIGCQLRRVKCRNFGTGSDMGWKCAVESVIRDEITVYGHKIRNRIEVW